jgi:hypothetical protein
MDATDATGSRSGMTLPVWGWLLAAAAVMVFWTVMMEAGAVAASGDTGALLHELFHDGRHLIGVPCH